MDAILKPVERVREALDWFLAAREQRLLYIQASEGLRIPILSQLAAIEGHARFTAPVIVLEAGVDEGDDGWETRAEELVEAMAAARERGAAVDPALVIRPLVPPHAVRPPVAAFARLLHAALGCVKPPLEGLLVVLAPAWVEDPVAWRDTLGPLVARPELATARFVVVDPEDGPARAVAEAFGPAAEIADGCIDRDAPAGAMATMVAAMASAPPGADAARAAGLAGPRELPPRRIRQPPPLTREQQAAAMASVGLPAAYADEGLMQRIRVAVMRAAEAMGQRRAPEAVRAQREARDLAVQAGLARESVLFEIMMGSYALQGGAPEAALQAFDAAAARAEAARLPELGAQAFLAKGGALLVAKRVDEAAVAYAEAGRLASAKLPAIAIEGYRMSGTLLVSLRREQQAISVWQRALEIADGVPAKDRAATTAPEVARALATVCRKHGLRAQADALDAQAAKLEEPPPEAAAGGAP